MLGEELSCLAFWKIIDKEGKGWLTLEEFGHLLRALKFNHLFHDIQGHETEPLTVQKLKKEFEFNLRSKRGEIKGRENIVIRFDLIRDIFLERGL